MDVYLNLNILGIDHFHNTYDVVKHKAKLFAVVYKKQTTNPKQMKANKKLSFKENYITTLITKMLQSYNDLHV